MSRPVPTLVIYRPKAGQEQALQALVEKHWPILKQLDLVSAEPARVWRATDKQTSAKYFVEMFSWKDETASDRAHHTPEVMALWEAMGAVLERLELAGYEPLV